MIPLEWFEQARERISPHILKTPLISDQSGQFFYKLENRQRTGSFKVRGALNKILALQPWERERGLVAASAGNHGQGVALAGQLTHARVIVFAPGDVSAVKLDAMRSLGAEVRLVAGGYELAEQTAIRFAAENQLTWVSPYNDGLVIAGQGTIALELMEQGVLSGVETCLIPLSGGGLFCGIAIVLKQFFPAMKIVGVQAAGSPFMHALWRGKDQQAVEEVLGLADGLEGAVEANAMTIPIVRQLANDIILVTEDEIARGMGYAWCELGEKIEGSAAVTLAATLSGKINASSSILIFSGGNVTPSIHNEVCEKYRAAID